METLHIRDRIEKYGTSDFIVWAFIAMMTDENENVLRFGTDENGCALGSYDVEIKINGVEVSLFKIFERLNKELDYLVIQKAEELLKLKIGNIVNNLYTLENHAEELVKRAGESLGYKIGY